MNAQDAWNNAYNRLELQFDRPTFDTWLKGAVFLRLEGDSVFIIGVRNSYARDMLQHRLYRNVRSILSEVYGKDVDLRFEVHVERENDNIDQEMPLFRLLAQQQESPVYEPLHRMVQRPQHPELPESELNPRYRFERFIMTKGNRIAYEAARAVAENPGRSYNPLMIYGGVGLGKTHLLQAIAHVCQTKGLHVIYIPSEVFTNDLIASIRSKTTAMFRERYRSADILLVDDVQFIAGKESTQEEFFHTFNALTTFNKQIVIASDRHPSELTLLEDRLRSRFEGGLVVDVQPLDFEARYALLDMWTREREVDLPANVLDMVAERAHSNVRELEGVFNQIVAKAQLGAGDLTLEGAEHTLKRFDRPRQHSKKRVTIEDVIDATAAYYNVEPYELTGKSRAGRINHARQVAMYLARGMTDLSLTQIGAIFERSHTTVLHGANKVAEDLTFDRNLQQQIDDIRLRMSHRT